MSRRILIQPSSPTAISLSRRHSFLSHTRSSSSSNSSCCSGRFGELAGGTTAECAAICCCCPLGLAKFLFLTIYKLPAGLCKRALRRKRRQQLIKKGLLPQRSRRCQCGCDDTDLQIHPMNRYDSFGRVKFDDDHEEDKEGGGGKKAEVEAMVKLEKEMWETFYGTGFWRSPSQREPPTASQVKQL